MEERENVVEAAKELELVPEYEDSEVSVSALEGRKPFYSMNREGEKVLAGHILQRDYENDRRLRVPVVEETGVVLGRTSSKWNIVDHYSAFLPALENGFEVKAYNSHRKGTEAMSFMSHPDLEIPKSLTMDWDLSVHSGNERESFVGVRVVSSMKFGASIRYTLGIFRQICVNGLMAKTLGMGYLSMSHTRFNVTEVNNWLQNRISYFTDIENNTPTFPEISSKILDWPIETLKRVGDDPEYLASIPEFASSPVKTIQRYVPKWGVPKLAEQFELARENLALVSPLDLLNCVTNVTNMSPRRSSSNDGIFWNMYYCIDPVFEATIQLADIGAFMKDVTSFSRMTA